MEKLEIVRIIFIYDLVWFYICSFVCFGKEIVFVLVYSFIKEIISLIELVDKFLLIEINFIVYIIYIDNDKKMMDFFIGFGS